MPALAEKARVRQPREKEDRTPDYVVRVRTGPARRNWATIGYAWKRDNGEGFSVKLHTLPIGNEWNGVLKLLPPYLADDELPEDGEQV